MLTLTGKLRQSGEITIKDKPFQKLWIETLTPRQEGPPDLELHELLIPADSVSSLPQNGNDVSVDVRAYAKGRDVAYAALAARPATPTHKTASKAS